jgi:hypothetical protein
VDSATALTPIIDGVEKDLNLCNMSRADRHVSRRGEGQEMTKHEVSRKRTLAKRNDMSESSCEQKERGTRNDEA